MTTQTLQIANQTLSVDDIVPMLHRYQVMQPILRGLVIDRALTQWQQSQPELNQQQAVEWFCQQQQIATEAAQATWLRARHLLPEDLAGLAVREFRLEQFKQNQWSHKVSSYFLERKPDLDQVVYSLIRTKDPGLANELYFRIQAGEATFAELAHQYSQGAEAETGGKLGPVPLSRPHPGIRKLLSISKPGELWNPQAVEDWFIILRLEKLLPVSLDESMQRYLIHEMFESWLQTEIQSFS